MSSVKPNNVFKRQTRLRYEAGGIIVATQPIQPIATHFSIAWSVCLFVCPIHYCTLLKPLDEFRCHLAHTLLRSSVTLKGRGYLCRQTPAKACDCKLLLPPGEYKVGVACTWHRFHFLSSFFGIFCLHLQVDGRRLEVESKLLSVISILRRFIGLGGSGGGGVTGATNGRGVGALFRSRSLSSLQTRRGGKRSKRSQHSEKGLFDFLLPSGERLGFSFLIISQLLVELGII